jgi:glyoxylase I family protein
MHSKERLRKISETFFQALRDKNFEAIPFSDDIVFRAPIAPGGSDNPIIGKQELFEKWWKPLEPALDGVEIKIVDHYFNDALTEVMTKVDFTIPVLGATLRGADQFVVNNEGRIAKQENHFDASPMKSYIHHICLRTIDFDVTRNFYGNVLGWKLVMEKPDLIIYLAGSVFIAFKKAEPRHSDYSTFSPFEVGLDHIAISCETEEELRRFTKKITDAGVENTGVKLDAILNKLYVAFKDPDRIAWEFYLK